MRRIRLILVVLICLGALVVYFGLTRRGAGPVYEGRSLEYWLEEYENGHAGTEAQLAVSSIGTNALPTLLAWASYEPRGGEDSFADLMDFFEQLLGNTPRSRFGYPESELKPSKLARAGFHILRWEAEPAVPALVDLLAHTNAFVQHNAADALACTGKSGIPPLLQVLTNSTHPARAYAQFALLEMDESYVDDSPVFPVLLRCMSDSDPHFAATTTMGVGMWGSVRSAKVLTALTNAFASPHIEVRYAAVRFFNPFFAGVTNAVPSLRSMLNDPDPEIRKEVSRILSQIDGEALTNAPPP